MPSGMVCFAAPVSMPPASPASSSLTSDSLPNALSITAVSLSPTAISLSPTAVSLTDVLSLLDPSPTLLSNLAMRHSWKKSTDLDDWMRGLLSSSFFNHLFSFSSLCLSYCTFCFSRTFL